MKSNYKTIEDLVIRIDERNFNNETDILLGVSIDKCFITSVANTIGTDLTKYKLIRKNDFAVSLMQVSRDSRIPIARQKGFEVAMMSPAYPIFRVKNPDEILPEYLEMWFKRDEFDREAAFIAVGGVRGSMPWNEFAQMQVYVPDIEQQKKMVEAYKIVEDRIELKRKINDNLLSQAQTYFSLIFADKDAERSLPQGWKVAKVGDYCVDNIANLSKKDTFESILYLDTSSITANYIVELQELNLLTDEIPSRAKRKATHGDIVYSTVRPNLKHYGLLQNPPENLIVSTGFAVLHNKGLGVTNDFLFMWLTNESILDYLQAIAENSVSTYPSLNVSDLMNVTIIVPDIDVLEKTTRFLASIFTAISENNRQIQTLTRSLDTLLPKLLSSY